MRENILDYTRDELALWFENKGMRSFRAGQVFKWIYLRQAGGFDEMTDLHVRFWVRDNGPGLTPEAQVSLFTPFTRLHQVRTEGHGLGLSIVQRIVEKLGGEVGIESQVGEGSLFYFTLPTTA